MKTSKLVFIALVTFMCSFCTSKKVDVVQNFDSGKYLGKWYEIARLDYKWEKNLNNVTASYSLRDNGMIQVDNKGYDFVNQEWKESIGKAKLTGNKSEGRLKVSFFGPFYADYNIVALDPDYKYALVIGDNTKYMWILSREPQIPEDVKMEYVLKGKGLGVNTDKLIWVDHTEAKQ